MLTFGAEHTFHARVDLPPRRRRRRRAGRGAARAGPAQRRPPRGLRALRRASTSPGADVPGAGCVAAAGSAGIDVLEALRADGRRWYPLLGGDRRIRELGVPYDISAHPFAAQAVLDGRVTHASRDELAALLDTDPAPAAAVAELVDRRARAPTDAAHRGRAGSTGSSAGTSPRAPLPDDAELARLLRALTREAAARRRLVVADPRRRAAARRPLDRRAPPHAGAVRPARSRPCWASLPGRAGTARWPGARSTGAPRSTRRTR